MTPSIRCLVLLTVCLGAACSAKDSAPRPTPTAKPAAEPARMPEAKTTPPVQEALTATAAQPPRSVLDGPAPEPKPSEREVAPSPSDAESEARAHEEPAPSFDRALDPSEVEVQRFVLATDVAAREPVGESEVFATDTPKIFAFVQVANEHGAPYAFRVHFESADGPAFPYGVKLEIPTAARFRTWAFTRVQRSPGRYRAVLRTLDGKEIAHRDFVIEGARDLEE